MQLAKRLGATVTGVCSTRNIELIRSLGTDHAIDYTIEDVTETTDRYDLVLQVAGTHRASQLRRLLTPKGTLVQLSGDSPNHWVGPLGRILAGRVLSVFVGQTVTSFTVQPNRDDLEVLASLVDRGVVRTNLERTYSLGAVAQAIKHVETGRTRGKVAITITPTTSDLEANRDDQDAPRRS